MHGLARHLAPCVAALLLCSTAGIAAGASGARDRLGALGAAERSAVLDLFATEWALARARGEAEHHARRARALRTAGERLRAHTRIVRRSLAATHARVARVLRRLYVEGDPEPIEVLLGARSLGAVLEGLDSLERGARHNRTLARQARLQSSALATQQTRLRRAQASVARARTLAEASVQRLEAAVGAQRATITGLRRRQGLTRARIRSLEAQALAAQRASARMVSPGPVAESPGTRAEATPAASSGGTTPDGVRTLVVDAVAYHLPGRTASGLPVGVGVIAVDASIIPLGTRVFVPGYGAAVAADTGPAIRGAIIDLWMPSTAAARAWGRRTVTITVYG